MIALVWRASILVLCLFGFASAASPPADQPSLAGRWQIVYIDTVLGPVEGVARVAKDESSVTVVLTHPRSGVEHTLTSTAISRAGKSVTMVLEGPWPGAEGYQLPPLGRRVIGQGSGVPVRLGRTSGNLPIVPSQRAEINRVTVELTFGSANDLSGTWRYKADADTGRDRTGAGRIGEFAFTNDGSGTALQSGPEYWRRPKPEIYAAVPIVDQLAAPYGNVRWPYPSRTGSGRVLLVVGRELPSSPEDPVDIVSLDPKITYFLRALRPRLGEPGFRDEVKLGLEKLKDALPKEKHAEAESLDRLLISASLDPGVLPGRAGFTLSRAEGTWLLQFGDYTGTLEIVRELTPNNFEATDFVFRPEFIRLQIRADRDLPYAQIPMILGRNGDMLRLGATRIIPAIQAPGEPRVYRTAPIALVDPRQPLAQGALQIEVAGGDTLTAVLGELGLIHLRPAQARAKVLITPADAAGAMLEKPTTARSLIWKEALSIAARCAGQPLYDWDKIGREVADSIYNFVIFTTGRHIRSVDVSIAEHAAMLMLRATFLELMSAAANQHQELLQGGQSDDRLLGFHKQFEPFAFRDDVPLAKIRVAAPDGSPVRLATTYLPELLKERYGLEGEAADRWILNATREALEKHLADMRHSVEKATNIGECDVEDLLDLTGFGFDAAVRTLKPRLMRLDELGTPPRLLWRPDELPRTKVTRLGVLAGAVRAQRELANVDTQMFLVGLSLATLPLTLVASPVTVAYAALAVDLADLAVTVAHEVPLLIEARAEVKFARGAAAVLGIDRLNEAERRETEQWLSSATAILGTGVGAATGGYSTWRTVLQARSIERGIRILASTGVDDVLKLPLAAKRDVLAALDEIRRLHRRVGRGALEAAEDAALKAAGKFEETWRPSRAQKPGWARGLDDAIFARFEEMRLRTDVARLVEQNPTAMARLIIDGDALEVLRGAPFENLAQLQEAVREAKRRIKVSLGEPFFRSAERRAAAGQREQLSTGLYIEDGVRKVFGKDTYEATVYFGADVDQVGAVVRSLETDRRRFPGKFIVTFDLIDLRSNPKLFPPSMVKVPGPLQLTDRGTPLAMLLNLRALSALGVQYADPRLVIVKLSTVVNANTAIQLHWMERVYGAANLNRYARYTHSVQYAEGALTQAGFKINKIELRGGNIPEVAEKMVNSGFYDGRVKPDDFLRRYDVALDEIVNKGHDIYLYVEPIR